MINPRQICQAAITASNVTVYTVPTATTTYLKTFDICNTTAGSLTFNVHIVPLSGAAGTANALYYESTLASKATFHWTGTQILTAGMFLSVKGSGTGMTITASGGESS